MDNSVLLVAFLVFSHSLAAWLGVLVGLDLKRSDSGVIGWYIRPRLGWTGRLRWMLSSKARKDLRVQEQAMIKTMRANAGLALDESYRAEPLRHGVD